MYRITFGDMKQTNVESKKQRTVRRLEPVGKPPAPTLAAAPTRALGNDGGGEGVQSPAGENTAGEKKAVGCVSGLV